jgi:ATP-dependent Clp protease ATP-binding subunit ClpC
VIKAKLPWSMRFERVVERSLVEADDLEDVFLGPEHLLLALLREPDGVAAHVRTTFGLDFERVRRAILEFREANSMPGKGGDGPA